MKKQILLLLLMLVGFGMQAQNLSWVAPISSSSWAYTKSSIAVDVNGNSYTVSFNNVELSVVKTSPTGANIWTHIFTEESTAISLRLGTRSIVVEGENVFITGNFDGSIYDDNDPFHTQTPMLGAFLVSIQIFVIKLNATTGTTLQATSLIHNMPMTFPCIAIFSGDIYIQPKLCS